MGLVVLCLLAAGTAVPGCSDDDDPPAYAPLPAPPPDLGTRGLTASFDRSTAAFPDYGSGTLPPAWGDYDGDGDLDLPLARNDGNLTFTEIPGFRALLSAGNFHGASWGDYDGDGHIDLAILTYERGRSVLLRNRGDGTFEDKAPALGLDLAGFGETAAWGDFDGDGDLDLFAPYYAHQAPGRSFLYRNDGPAGFTDIADSAGVALRGLPHSLRPEGAQWVDVDDDGDLDLYCAHHLFENRGNQSFRDVRDARGLPQVFDEGAQLVDYDNDGDFDLYLRTETGGRLFRNDGARFREETARAGVPSAPLFWGDSWADVDHDGDLDLLFSLRDEPSRLLLNQGNGGFVEDVSFRALDLRELDTSAWGDVDGDGDLDVVLSSRARTLCLNQLDRSASHSDSWLRVRVLDALGHQTQHGATARLRRLDLSDGRVQTRCVDGGSGFLTQDQYDVHFGVAAQGTYALEVSFPATRASPLRVGPSQRPVLTGIVPSNLTDKTILVHRDGRVLLDGVSYGP